MLRLTCWQRDYYCFADVKKQLFIAVFINVSSKTVMYSFVHSEIFLRQWIAGRAVHFLAIFLNFFIYWSTINRWTMICFSTETRLDIYCMYTYKHTYMHAHMHMYIVILSNLLNLFNNSTYIQCQSYIFKNNLYSPECKLINQWTLKTLEKIPALYF